MNPKQIITLIFGTFVVILIALTGTFTEIINGFYSAMGFYGFIIGILIVIGLIFAFLGVDRRRR